ncbi:FKBP-type peptidyl-prolyl cis-trans isomerase [uncultured Jatrophihabitans sp.]|uniref:FKBP-type peptidyl-prolyl cis-trans isomerase n=1 Tax=uncultured Jatrophihabitans sp. TaxID=1610747 RepID=UPI0035CAE2FC
MDARSKRREATRRQLEQQLRERQAREARRKRATLIASVVGTVAVIALVIVLVVTLGGGSDNGKKQAGSSDAVSATATPSASPSTAASSAPPLAAPAACAKPSGKASATFDGVGVGNAVNLKKDPKVTSTSTTTPKALTCSDLVVGKGKAASATSTVSVQYSGVLYKNGKQFDSSWARGGKPASFSLAQVVPGFTQGIAGTGKVPPMKVGGRRILILPAQLGYGSQAQQGIPANSTLVFVVDLVSVS